MNSEYCIQCGDEIPEGRMVCPACEAKAASKNIFASLHKAVTFADEHYEGFKVSRTDDGLFALTECVERKTDNNTAEWLVNRENVNEHAPFTRLICSKCNMGSNNRYPFCPSCGRKMIRGNDL